MARAIWKGDINFGLVYIPVTLQSAEVQHKSIRLNLLDKRDYSPIGFERINKVTGKPVSKDNIVEGFEYKPGSYAVLTEDELEHIRKKSTHNIDILAFVNEKDIDPILFEKPYYLIPEKKGLRAYVLLLETLKQTGKVGITKVVIHTHQYLAAVAARKNLLVLEVIRFNQELKRLEDYGLSNEEIKKIALHEKEMTMAKQLIQSMSEKWHPEKYHDDYREQFLNFVEEKVRRGDTALKEAVEEKDYQPKKTADVIDLMSLLKKSIPKEAANEKTIHRSRTPKRRTTKNTKRASSKR